MQKHLTWGSILVAFALAAGCGSKSPPAGGGTGPGTGGTGGTDGTGGDTTGDPAGGGAAEAPAPVAKGNPRTDLIPREMFFGNPERTGVRISPDGKHLSWLAPKDGVLNVWVAPIDDLAKAKPVTADATRPVRIHFWSYDGKYVLYAQDKGGDENFHLHRVDLASGEVTDVTPVEGARAQVLALSHEKPHLVLIGLNDRDPKVFDVYQLDLRTGERKLVVENDQQFVAWHIDEDLNVRFADRMEPDGTVVTMAYQPKKKQRWAVHDKVPPEDQLTTSIIGFDDKGTTYYALDSRGRDTAALFQVDAKSKKKKLLVEDARADVGGVMMHPTKATPQAASVVWDRQTWKVLDKKIAKDLEAIGKLAAGDYYVSSRTLDDKTWIVAFDGDRSSTQYYLWDRGKQQGTFLFSARPELDDLKLAAMHPVVIKSRDGLDLVSYLTLPVDADPDGDAKPNAPVPMVLLVHGGPWGRDGWGFDPIHQLLANRGYAVLSVNFRGSTGFGKEFLNAANKEWGKKMHDDLLDAVDWAVKGGVAPKDKVCIMGGSYGGYATLVGLTMTPEVFACGVDIVGPSNIVTLLETIPPYWAPMINVFKLRVGDHTTDEGKQALLEVSPLTHVDKIQRPLLIGQGANDPRVKQSESDQIVKAMTAKNIPVTYVLFPDEGHGFARPENNLAFFAVTEAFLSAHLGGYYQPITPEELAASSMKIVVGENGVPGLPERETASR